MVRRPICGVRGGNRTITPVASPDRRLCDTWRRKRCTRQPPPRTTVDFATHGVVNATTGHARGHDCSTCHPPVGLGDALMPNRPRPVGQGGRGARRRPGGGTESVRTVPGGGPWAVPWPPDKPARAGGVRVDGRRHIDPVLRTGEVASDKPSTRRGSLLRSVRPGHYRQPCPARPGSTDPTPLGACRFCAGYGDGRPPTGGVGDGAQGNPRPCKQSTRPCRPHTRPG